MRTGSNHEYREAKMAVRLAYQKYYGLNPILFKEDMERHEKFIKDAASQWGVTERTIKRWIKSKATGSAAPLRVDQGEGGKR